MGYADLSVNSATQDRFGVQYVQLPHIVYISRGHWYRYQVLRDDTRRPVLKIADLLKFVEQEEYLAIPDVFPADHGEIKPPQGLLSLLSDLLSHEIAAKGGVVNFLMMKQADGQVYVSAFLSIYGGLSVLLLSIYFMCKDAKK